MISTFQCHFVYVVFFFVVVLCVRCFWFVVVDEIAGTKYKEKHQDQYKNGVKPLGLEEAVQLREMWRTQKQASSVFLSRLLRNSSLSYVIFRVTRLRWQMTMNKQYSIAVILTSLLFSCIACKI